jgi:putative addiction module component (TIGR02574 family)
MTVKDQILQLPKEEKLMLMEALWEDLSRDGEQFESPAWHGEILKEREKALQEGKDRFLSVEEARAELKNRRKG